MNTVRPANAGAVTRVLVAAGMRKGSSMASGMVRGWHTYYEGVKSEQGGQRHYSQHEVGPANRRRRETTVQLQPDGIVWVEYQLGDGDRRASTAERNAKVDKYLSQAAGILRAKGYHVEEHRDSKHVLGRLAVSRRNEAGEVVKP